MKARFPRDVNAFDKVVDMSHARLKLREKYFEEGVDSIMQFPFKLYKMNDEKLIKAKCKFCPCFITWMNSNGTYALEDFDTDHNHLITDCKEKSKLDKVKAFLG